MSGSALKGFVTRYQNTDQKDRLVTRMKNGVPSNTFKPIDYESLWMVANEKRASAEASLLKVKQLQQTTKQRKEQNLGQQHKFVWHKEFSRLASLRKRFQAELQTVVEDGLSDEELSLIFADIDSYSTSLAEEFNLFQRTTANPVWTLRDELKNWLKSQQAPGDDVNDLRDRLDSVANQQDNILQDLATEQANLEAELAIDGLYDHSTVSERHMQTGIPEEAFDLECPDMDWKISLLQEFILLDGKYVEKLTELEKEHAAVINCMHGGWTASDHDTFIYVTEQYQHHEAHNRRLLFIDMLRKLLPDKTREEIVEHEEWSTRCKFYQHRRRDLMTDWIRDRTELLNRISVTFAEAIALECELDAKAGHIRRQKEICEELYAKVQQWREKKMEAMQLQIDLATEQRLESEKATTQAQQMEKRRRDEQKQNIRKYHGELEARRREIAERDRRRLEELKRDLEAQAIIDHERVNYRDEEWHRRQEEKRKKIEENEAAKEEKERMLDELREKVRPHVESDLLRLWSDTIAWQRRQQAEDNISILRPLFDVKSFTTKQVIADPRFRLEQHLREAGIHDTAYAREALAQVKPLHKPRKDTVSTVFK